MVLLPAEMAENNPTRRVRTASLLRQQHQVALARCLTLLSPKETTATP